MNDIYTLSMIISLATFMLTAHISPGPTNIVLLSSVINFGYRKSVPFIIGNILSYLSMVILIAFGLGLFFNENPNIMSILRFLGVTYLCWMAWKIANDSTSPTDNESTQSKPFNFVQSLIYPWLNPKGWIVYSSTISIYVTSAENSFLQISIIVFFIFISLIITTCLWSMGGLILKKFMKNTMFLKRLNQTMALLLVASIVPVMI